MTCTVQTFWEGTRCLNSSGSASLIKTSFLALKFLDCIYYRYRLSCRATESFLMVQTSFPSISDPCFDFSVRSYDHKGNCRAHWSCENGLSTARCCPLGFAYHTGEGCVRDDTCKDWCEDSGELTFSAPFGRYNHGYFEVTFISSMVCGLLGIYP